jgi:5-methylcytosine-specific restriction endonuclease McrA
MNLTTLKDEELETKLQHSLANERKEKTLVIEALAEVDARGLWAKQGFSSFFAYCVEKQHLSESSAGKRIQVVKAVQKHPYLLEYLQEGKLHLSAVVVLSPHLDKEYTGELVQRSCHQSRSQIEKLIVTYAPKAIPKDSLRKGRQSEWLTEEFVHYNFAVRKSCHEKMERAKQLLKHKVPAGSLDAILENLLDTFLSRKDPDLKLAKKHPSQTRITAKRITTRHIPQGIKDAVWKRDGGCCSFVSPTTGRRCGERAGIEYDHIKHWSIGGESTVENLRLLCFQHHKWMTRRQFSRLVLRHGSIQISSGKKIQEISPAHLNR